MRSSFDSKSVCWVAFLFVSMLIIPAFAQAQGDACVPVNAFYGDVTVNGIPAPVGLTVTAKYNDNDLASTPIAYEGIYGQEEFWFNVPDPDTNCENTHLIKFYVEDQYAGEAMFENGIFTKLDLSATGIVVCGDNTCEGGETCSTCSQDCGSCVPPPSDGGGGSTGGGGGFISAATTEDEVINDSCTIKWVCSPWTQCVNFTQSRVCIDTNVCGIETSMPVTVRSCGIIVTYEGACSEEGKLSCADNNLMECLDGEWSIKEECSYRCANNRCEESSGFDITGLFLNPATLYIGFLVVIVIFGAGLFLKFR